MRYVIVGNSAAAAGAVEAIRQTDRQGTIAVVSSEPWHIYSRPLISYYLLGQTDLNRMQYRGTDFYETNRVHFLPGQKVVKLDPAQKAVLLESGKRLAYDKLLVATGSSAFVPPVEGLDTAPQTFTFMSLDDALALERALTPERRVLIVGAGLIGLKCAEGICARVGRVTVVDMAPRVLSSILDDEAAALAQAHLEAQGLQFYLNNGVKRFAGNTAQLQSGASLEFDILVLAAGVRPNGSLVQAAGGQTNRGVVVNAQMQTSLPDIYAAGDCAEAVDVTGSAKVLALLPNAYRQGECAGHNMAGQRCEYTEGLAMNAIGFFGLPVATAGDYTGQVFREAQNGALKKIYYANDRLQGFQLLGNVEKAGIYTRLLREQTPLSSIDFDLICRQPGLMAFSKAGRETMLGGAV
jgi:NAD(P)H-nitrite reductase large subunit